MVSMSINSSIAELEMQIEQLQVQIDEIVRVDCLVEQRLLAQIVALKTQVTELETAVKEAKKLQEVSATVQRLEADKVEAMRADLSDVMAQNRGLAMVVTSLAGRLSSLEPG